MKRTAFLLFLMVFGGPLLSFYGCQNVVFHSRLESRGISVPGLVEEAEKRTSTNRLTGSEVDSNYTFYASYTPQGEKEIYKKFKVTKDFVNNFSSSKVTIKYLPEDPTQAIIVGGSTEWGYLWWVGLLVCAVGTISVYIAYKYDVFTSDD